MSVRQVAAEFDEISRVYDETREPLDSGTLDRLARALEDEGVSRLLEVGVGTGRVALPLATRGLEVVGLDASPGMLARARAKGLGRLVRGTAYHLPFRDAAVDATLYVHVLHVLDDPGTAIREGARVARTGVWALVHPQGDGLSGGDEGRAHPRAILRDVLAELGYSLGSWRTPAARERELLRRMPPDRLEVVRDREVTELVRDRLLRLAKRGQRSLLPVPPDVVRRAVEIATERVGDRAVTYRSVEGIARWTGGPSDAGTTGRSGDP
jgi:ubiquinone/menaquinone biosynthesis C-methylase UbiE